MRTRLPTKYLLLLRDKVERANHELNGRNGAILRRAHRLRVGGNGRRARTARGRRRRSAATRAEHRLPRAYSTTFNVERGGGTGLHHLGSVPTWQACLSIRTTTTSLPGGAVTGCRHRRCCNAVPPPRATCFHTTTHRLSYVAAPFRRHPSAAYLPVSPPRGLPHPYLPACAAPLRRSPPPHHRAFLHANTPAWRGRGRHATRRVAHCCGHRDHMPNAPITWRCHSFKQYCQRSPSATCVKPYC